MSKPDKRTETAAAAQAAAPAMHPPGRPGPLGGGFNRGGGSAKPRDVQATLRRLWSYFGGERKLLGVVAAFVAATSVFAVLGPYLIGVAVDAVAAHDRRLLFAIVGALTAAYIGEGLFTFLQGWLMAGVSQRVVLSLRASLFGKLQKLPLSYFDSRPHGEVMSRLSNDIDNVSNTISQSAAQLMAGAIAIVGSFIMMLALSPLLTLAALVTVPLVFLLARTITKRTRVMFKEQQAQLGALNGQIEETITGQQIVKAFNREAKAIEQFDDVNAKLYQASIKAQIWSGFLMPLLSVINNIGFATIAFVGGWMAVNGSVTVGVIASFIGYSRQFVRPLNELAQIYNMLQAGLAGAERAFEVLDEREEPDDAPGAVPLRQPLGRVTFEGVGFGYRPDVPILQDVNFETPAGSCTALVGPTGAGKTTIVNLLARFYDVTEGRILIDGRDIREYTRESLRKTFGIVLQDTYLFSGTIRENIKYGNPDASDEDVVAAAELAGADRFIRRLPDGYDTPLAENGGNISQGQRQLLAIARVILAQPSILILDEATSSIDTRTELQIQEALFQLMKRRTSFVIAHRLNTIRDADAIMVIDRGRVAEQGSHDELMRSGKTYYEMFMNQFRNVQNAME